MKRNFLCSVLLLIMAQSFSQQPAGPMRPESLYRQELLQKVKSQKTLMWVTGGAGLAIGTAGLILGLSEFGNGLPGGTGFNESRARAGDVLMYIGGGLVLVSIPIGIAYEKNKKLLASLSFMNNTSPFPGGNAFATRFVPTCSLKLTSGEHNLTGK